MVALGRCEWRPMRAGDVDAVAAVAALAFPDHFEERGCFEERLSLFPQGCFALASTNEVRGYLIAYPWRLGEIPPLNSLLGALPDTSDALYLHDLALHPDVRGQGHARPIVEHLATTARAADFRWIALVSVNESAAFWRSLGFEAASDPALAEKLASYGYGATYLMRRL